MLQGVNHGLSTPLLFLAVGIVYDQRHTREIADYGGLANRMPVYTVLFAISLFASMGMPGLNGFIGEFTILRGAFEVSIWWGRLCRPWASSSALPTCCGSSSE